MKASTMTAAALAAVFFSSSPASADGSTVAARVNGKPITEAQVSDFTTRLGAAAAAEGGGGAAAAPPRADVLEAMINLELLAQAAQKEKVAVSNAEVNAEIDSIKSQYESPAAFQEALKQASFTEAKLRAEFRQQLMAQKLLEKHLTTGLPPDAVEKFYQENVDEFRRPEQVRASHILFRLPEDADREAVRKRADETLARIKKGEDFDAVAKELSTDPASIENNGDLGFFDREDAPKAIADTAFSLKKGEVSGVVESPFGLHLIKVTDTRPAGTASLEEVKPEIEKYLLAQQRETQAESFIEELKKGAKIEIVAPAK